MPTVKVLNRKNYASSFIAYMYLNRILVGEFSCNCWKPRNINFILLVVSVSYLSPSYLLISHWLVSWNISQIFIRMIQYCVGLVEALSIIETTNICISQLSTLMHNCLTSYFLTAYLIHYIPSILYFSI